ncbi:MAG: DNA-binding protein WhiA [Acholeplasmatales bacterium]|jgi:DNA-binding protein WhiA|nr:DNA-binding protein WhiA [Acholeplasmatales bacterium]
MISTFSKLVKEEIIKKPIENSRNLIYEYQALMDLLGDVKLSNGNEQIVFSSNNISLVKYFLKLSNEIFSIHTQNIVIEENKIKPLKTYYAYFNDFVPLILERIKYYTNRELIEIENLSLENKIAYLKGAFLASGSISNPLKKDYHLEIASDSMSNILYIGSLLNSLDLNAKIAMKRNKYIAYIKRIENICTFLAHIQAMNSYFQVRDIMTKRSLNVQIQRSINTELANAQRTMKKANELVDLIEKLRKKKIELAPELEEIAQLRIDYPDSSLRELMLSYKNEYHQEITRSMLYRKLEKIKSFAMKV